jgi:ACS family hexuronate transporter-like MFS transporter
VTKIGGMLFDYYGAQGQIQTGYMIMFTFCALAYLAAWGIMKVLVPTQDMVRLPEELAHA